MTAHISCGVGVKWGLEEALGLRRGAGLLGVSLRLLLGVGRRCDRMLSEDKGIVSAGMRQPLALWTCKAAGVNVVGF